MLSRAYQLDSRADGPGPSGSAGYPGAMVRLPDGNLAFVDNLAYTVRVMTPSAVKGKRRAIPTE